MMRPVILGLLLSLAASSLARAQPSKEALDALQQVVEEHQAKDAKDRPAPGQDPADEAFREWERELAAAEVAVGAAIAAEAAGAAPDVALRPVAALQGRTPLLPRLAAEMQTVSPRTVAYGELIRRATVGAERPRPSKPLALAAAAAWEAELVGLRNDPVLMFEAGRLAEAYAKLGDLPAARRVADLDPRAGPLARVEVLARAQAWDEAADLAARTTVGDVAAILIREAQLEYEVDRSRRSPAEARLAALMPQFDAKPDPARLREEAAAQLEAARVGLVDLARRQADAATARRVETRLDRRAP